MNFQLSETNLILSGFPSIILFSLSLFTEITSATNFTVANKLSLIFSYFSTDDSFTPMNVNSDFIFSLFLALIASEKFENIFGESNDFNLIKSPLRTTFPSSNIYNETNIKIDPYKFLIELNKNIVKKIDYWNYGLNYKAILEQWIEKAYLLNKEISVTLPNGKKEKGIFSSIDNEGGLILSTKKSDKVFYAAEIFEGL